MRRHGLPSWVKVSAPFVVYVQGEGQLDLSIALREPRVLVEYPPKPGGEVDEISTPCGPVKFSYTISKPDLLAKVQALEVYAGIIARSALSLSMVRLCLGGSTSISEAVRLAQDMGSEQLAYAISLGGAVVSRRVGGRGAFIGRWHLPEDLVVALGPGEAHGSRYDVVDLLSKLLTPELTEVCTCFDARLGVSVTITRGTTPKAAFLVTRFDNRGAEVQVPQA
ncbi:MAG: hypothetical protein ACP5FT_03210 [Acidilobus sp.]